jgi:hypothetical protein
MKRIFVLLIFAALSQAATVSSITCNAQVATVNATAHGLIASQGFSLSGTAGTYNSTVGTAGGAVTANTFTFTLPTGTACSGFTSGYTTVVPVKQIIDISSSANPANATVTLNYLYWFTTAYPNPLPLHSTCHVGWCDYEHRLSIERLAGSKCGGECGNCGRHNGRNLRATYGASRYGSRPRHDSRHGAIHC